MMLALLLDLVQHAAVPPAFVTVTSYACEVKGEYQERSSRLQISYLVPIGGSPSALKELRIDDPSDVISYLEDGKVRGEISGTDVIELFPEPATPGVFSWLRLVPPDHGGATYALTHVYSASGHPIISDLVVGTCEQSFSRREEGK